MLYQLSTDGSMEIDHIDSVAPWFDGALAKGPNFLASLQSPRIFKSHRTLKELPQKVRRIYVVRNPKDTCVSYYHHLTRTERWPPTIEEFTEVFVAGRLKWGSWFRHIESSSRFIHDPTVLTLKYEDISQDLMNVVQRVSKFCGVDLTNEKLERVMDRCTFNFMKKYNSKFDPLLADTVPARTQFIRKGQVGTWLEELSPAATKRIDRRFAETLSRIHNSSLKDQIMSLPIHKKARTTSQ